MLIHIFNILRYNKGVQLQAPELQGQQSTLKVTNVCLSILK